MYAYLFPIFGFILVVTGEISIQLGGRTISDWQDNNTVKVIEGDTLSLDCVYNTTGVNYVEWRRGDSIISRSDRLELSRIRIEYEGNYSCSRMFENNVPDATVTDEESFVYVKVLYPPSYPIIDVPTHVLKGENLSITCMVDAEPEPTFQWRRDSEHGLLLSRNKTYNIFMPSSGFGLVCLIQNLMSPTVGEPKTGYVHLKRYFNVQSKCSITSFTPGRYVDTDVGQTLFLNCYVAGSPSPTVWWTKNGDDILFWHGGRYVSYDIRTSAAGEYICHVENTVTASNGTAITTHQTETIHVKVYGEDDDNNSQPETKCSECLRYCPSETVNIVDTTTLRSSSSNSNSMTNLTSPDCAGSSTVANSSVEQSNTIIWLAVFTGIGWLVAQVVLVVIYFICKHKRVCVESNDISGSIHPPPTIHIRGQGQTTEHESVYVSNVRFLESSYTDLTTYDQITSCSNSSTNGDADSVSTQESTVTYLQPTNSFTR